MVARYVTYFINSSILVLLLQSFVTFDVSDKIANTIAMLSIFSTIVLLRIFQKLWIQGYKETEDGQILIRINPYPPMVIILFATFIALFGFIAVADGWNDMIDAFDEVVAYLILTKNYIVLIFTFFCIPFIFKYIAKSKNMYVASLAGYFLNNNLFYSGSSYKVDPVALEVADSGLFSTLNLKNLPPDTPYNRKMVIADLRSRAAKLQIVNGLILSFIVIVLMVSAVFIVFAGEIASRDTQSVSLLQSALNSRKQIESELNTFEKNKAEISNNIENGKLKEVSLKKKIEQIEPDDQLVQSAEKLNKLQLELDKVVADKISAETRLIMVQRQIERKEKEFEDANELIKSIKEKSISAGGEVIDPITGVNLLIAAGITRFGVLAITIYLVQILLNLYRYNIRVSGFYLSRAHALTIMDHPAKKINDLSNFLEPAIDFGKQPSTLLEKFSDNLGSIVEKAVSQAIKIKEKN